MTNSPILRGFAAALLTVSLVAQYADPVYCEMSGHMQSSTNHTAMVSPLQQPAPNQSHVCHDGGPCGIVSVAPVLALGAMLPVPSTVAFGTPAAGGALIDNTIAPKTPPPRA
jgi:hypothetical protein